MINVNIILLVGGAMSLNLLAKSRQFWKESITNIFLIRVMCAVQIVENCQHNKQDIM